MTRLSLSQRLFAKVDKTDSCWLWTGSKSRGGYGQIRTEPGRSRYVHRIAYELLRGPIPEGLELDHLCRTRSCVNPDHLEPITRTENNRRAASFHAAKTHCPSGHRYTRENTTVSCGKRICRTCRHNRRLARSPEQIAKERAYNAAWQRRRRSSEVDLDGNHVDVAGEAAS